MDKKTAQGALLGIIAIASQFLAIIPQIAPLAAVLSFSVLTLSHIMLSSSLKDKSIASNTAIFIAISIAGSALAAITLYPFSEIPKNKILAAAAVLYITNIASFYTLAKAYYAISLSTGIRTFKTAGNLLFYGAMGVIVLGIGLILITAGWIAAAIGYYRLSKIAGQTS